MHTGQGQAFTDGGGFHNVTDIILHFYAAIGNS